MKEGIVVRTEKEFFEAVKDCKNESLIIWIDGINVTDREERRELIEKERKELNEMLRRILELSRHRAYTVMYTVPKVGD